VIAAAARNTSPASVRRSMAAESTQHGCREYAYWMAYR